MLIRNLGKSIRNQDWFAVLVEVLVVMVGLFIAFQLDRWWEQRGDRLQEQIYIQRLASEVQTDIETISYAINLAKIRKDFADLLMEAGHNPAAAMEKPVQFLAAVVQAPYTFTPSLVAHTFEDLRSTGNMSLIRSSEVKAALYDYYGFDEAQRQFIALQQMIEFGHFELTTGVLSNEQYLFVQDRWFVVTPETLHELESETVNREQVRQAVQRLQERPEALAWLQRVRGVQQELILMNEYRLRRAEALVETLNAYTTSNP
jgi:hypothetical protein